jgi:hypothetical protein
VTAWLRTIAVLLVVAAAAMAGLASMSPPAARPASAPAGLFSAERAMGPLSVIASRPHPVGTPAASDVRATLVDALTRLGFDVSVQDTTSLTDRPTKHGYPVVAAHVRNVVARRAGTEGPPTVLLSAHYDSRELAPGASDDGYGTVVLLETARALSTLPPLRHDLILLVSEGEEEGLLGAKAFVEDSPLARDVAVVVNVDSRGDRGPGLMFQTSENGSELVETLARVAPRVTAASLSQEVYRRMPNGTDFSEWLGAGRAGLDFASIDGFERYHQTTDTVANADPRTVQQLGDQVLGLARALGDMTALPPVSTHDDVYFDAGPVFVRYDARDALPLGILALAGTLAATIVAARRRLLTARDALAGLAAAALVPTIAALIALALVWLSARADEALVRQTLRDGVRKECLAAFILLGAGVAWSCGAALLRRIAPLSLLAGVALHGSVLAVATAVWFPGGSFTFLWASLALAAVLVVRAMRSATSPRHQAFVVATVVAPAIACLILTPMAWQLGIVFGVSAAPALAAIAAAAVLPAPACVGVTAIAPQRAVAVALIAGGLGLLGVALATPAHDAGSPQPDSLMVAIDDDHDRAWWLSIDDHPDRWTGRVLPRDVHEPRPEIFPRQPTRLFLGGPAPAVPHRGPRVAIVADEHGGATRHLRLHLSVTPDTEAIEVLAPPAAHVTARAVEDRPFGPAGDGWLDLVYFGPPDDGLDLELTALDDAIELTVVTQTPGLPAALLAPLGPRPPDLMPRVWSPMPASDMTLVAGRFQL